ncbi:Ger(x)C family spore germination protein [Paenibacillus sedimenti]|uniref:Ger(x)C family spore germination protein n=1 Tax=Paenibacillus sedimenti TaxID=2770274 RepID=UPI00165F537F|nr:Ger(x)C family spore germination protein [Paenibacillus sedimenti]
MAIVILIGIPIPLSGCWDQREINQLAIINMLGVNKIPGQPTLELYYQSINPSGVAAKQGGGPSSPVYTYKVTGSSAHASFTYEVSDILPRQLFPDHYQAIIISETFARYGISRLLNSYELQSNRRANVELVVTDSPMNKVMNTYIPFEKIPGKSLTSIINIQSKTSARAVKNSRFKDLIEKVDSSKATVVNFIRLNANKSDNTTKNLEKIDAYQRSFVLNGGAVFLRDRMVGKISINDITWYSYLTENAESFLQHLTIDRFPMEVEVGKSKVKKKLIISDGIPIYTFQITSDLRLRSDNTAEEMRTDKVNRIESAFNAIAEKEAGDFIKRATEKGWDLLGIHDQIAYQRSKEWKTALDKDSELWKKTRFVIHVKAVMSTGGTLMRPYISDIKEE